MDQSPLEGSSTYPTGDVEKFARARNMIYGGNIKGLVSLQLESKVRMTLADYEAIGAEMQRLRGEVDYLQRKVTAVRTAVQ